MYSQGSLAGLSIYEIWKEKFVSDFAAHNLMLLLQHHSAAAKGLQEHLRKQREEHRQSPYQIHAAKNGQPCLTNITNQKPQALHSQENPMQQTVAHMQPHMAKQPGMIFLYSVGLGYALQALKNWILSNRLVLVEPDYDILFEFLRINHWNAFLSNPNLHVFAGENAVDDAVQLLQLHPSLHQKSIACFSGRLLLEQDEAGLKRLQQVTGVKPELESSSGQYAFLCGDAHERLVQPFVEEAKHAGLSMRGIHRPAYINTFLAEENLWRETLREPLPKRLAAFSKHALRRDEWSEIADSGIETCLWCYDDPFRGSVDANFFNGVSKIYCYDPFITDKLRDVSPVGVEYLYAATAFDADSPNRCNSFNGQTWDITFVGSTGLQRHDDVLTQWINGNHPIYQNVCAFVESCLQQGNPVSYDELVSIGTAPVKLSPSQKTVYLQDLATFMIRRYFLGALLDGPLQIFGDRGWIEERWVGGLKQHYAEQSLRYDEESPYVYANSRINLNLFNIQCVNSPTIRMFDVMACGGFLLTEYRPFMDRFFHIGEHLDVFRTREELAEKVQYYLEHDDERKRTAQAGQAFVLEHHRYRHRFPILFQTQ